VEEGYFPPFILTAVKLRLHLCNILGRLNVTELVS